MKTYSVSFRLQRTTTEYAYVPVPVTPDVVIPQHDGTVRLNAEKMLQIAVAQGQSPEVVWHPEDATIQLHPIQKTPELEEQ